MPHLLVVRGKVYQDLNRSGLKGLQLLELDMPNRSDEFVKPIYLVWSSFSLVRCAQKLYDNTMKWSRKTEPRHS